MVNTPKSCCIVLTECWEKLPLGCHCRSITPKGPSVQVSLKVGKKTKVQVVEKKPGTWLVSTTRLRLAGLPPLNASLGTSPLLKGLMNPLGVKLNVLKTRNVIGSPLLALPCETFIEV